MRWSRETVPTLLATNAEKHPPIVVLEEEDDMDDSGSSHSKDY